MNFRQLECFVAVVDEGSFTRAARRIGITQPSLSQHIRALEAELDGAVLDRLPRGVSLTPAGRGAAPGGAHRGARARARPAGRALGARARARRARDRDGALDGGRRAAAPHRRLARAPSERRRSGCTSSGTARCSRTPSSRASPTSRSARCRCAVGRPARDRRRGRSSCVVVAPPDPLAGREQRPARGARATASGCSTTRTTASPASSRRSAGAPGSARAGRCARRRPRAPSRLAAAGLGLALVPDNIVAAGHRLRRCCASSRA